MKKADYLLKGRISLKGIIIYFLRFNQYSPEAQKRYQSNVNLS